MKKILIVIICCLLTISCVGLKSTSSHVPSTATLAPDKGGVEGFIRTPNPIDQRGLIVYLATILHIGEDRGGFLDLANAPFAHVQDNGYFRIDNVPPGEYILVVYEVVMGGKALQDDNGDFIVIQIQRGIIRDLGVVNFNLE